FMVKASYEQKPFRKAIMKTFGAEVFASPSNTTKAGRAILAADPTNTGSLGCAISEAVEKAVTSDNCKYVLGSVLNQVLLHQSIIGLESAKAMEILGEYPDVVIGCAGGGSNLGGLIAPFVKDKVSGKANPELVAIEPASCPSLTRGQYAYDFCDTGKITPLAKMYTLGCSFTPSPIHAGGLRYHGMSPILSKLYHDGYMTARSVVQSQVFEAATFFAKYESILPAPESAHAILGAIEEAKRCKETGEAKTILFGLTGTGFFDMTAYAAYQEGNMVDYVPTDEELAKGFSKLPQIPGEQNK
ncbi:MAG: TrpB-like pyridoxal phosphate-dependent enzyme, partial [Acidaminococcaceae bacterium]|nr:TrpB-like pyridoxal phosphate-dependent enzyme [Acidaminococcaceae bacterium]